MIVMCISSLSFDTLAWFTDTIKTKRITIQAANYDIDTLIKDTENNLEPIILSEDSSMEYIIEPNKKYTITLTASGTATTGFCKIIVGDKEYYTRQILTSENENNLSFTVNSYINEKIIFIPYWGTYSGDSVIDDNDEIIIGNSTQIPEDIEVDKPDNSNNEISTTEPTEQPNESEEDTEMENLIPDIDNDQESNVFDEDITVKPNLEDEFINLEDDMNLEVETTST